MVSALRSFDGSKGVSFHTSVPEDGCVHLLIKNLGGHMPEDVVWEELETLGISVQGVLQVCTRCHDQETSKACPLTPHFIVSVAQGPEVVYLCSLQVSVEKYITPKGPLQCKCCRRVSHTQCYCGYAPRSVACGETHLSGECCISQLQHLCCCSCGRNHTANY
jgi:hypothetical protein